MKSLRFTSILLIFLLVGCSKSIGDIQKIKEKDYQDKLKTYALNYYETYEVPFQKEVPSTYEVSLKAMKTAIANAAATYDLSLFINCEEETKAILELDKDGKVIGYDFILECTYE